MNWLSNLRLREQVLFLIGTLTAITLVITVLGINNVVGLGHTMETMVQSGNQNAQSVEQLRRSLVESQAEGQDAVKSALLITIVAGLVLEVVVLLLGFYVTRFVRKPLRDLVDNIDTADLNSVFESQRRDEFGELTRAMGKFVGAIRETLIRIVESSTAVASATAEISSSTEEMAAGAQQQSTQAGDVSAAVEEMTKTIYENSRNAGVAAETAKTAREAAEHGGRVVLDSVDGMKRIAKSVGQSAEIVRELGRSGQQIGQIVSVIDDIADQTNLLALNAAIEAARAGDQGRGFAVVADEVRKLAERTTKATKEIAEMIKKIQKDTREAVGSMEQGTKEVEMGIKAADAAGQSLKQIVDISEQVTEKVVQIAAGSEQQAGASEQISKNVEAISAVTQETASGIQQMARTAEDLNRLTENLQELIGRFKLGLGRKLEQAAEGGNGSAQGSFVRQDIGKGGSSPIHLAVRQNGHLVEEHARNGR